MTLRISDRVWDITSTTGTGTITLSNTPPVSYQSFGSVCSTGDTIYYSLASRSPNNYWEVGLGTFNSSGPTLARTTILASSSGGSAVTLVGTTDVIGVWPARELLAPPVTYYISAAGSDSNSGLTPSSAWASISKVNAQFPGPGTSFLFRVGDSFSGTITPTLGGSASLPIIYGSYGETGNAGLVPPAAATATISAGNGGGFTATDLSYITVQNLNFTGSGPGTNSSHGILFTNSSVPFRGITVQNCVSNNFGYDGIRFASAQVGGVNDTIIVTGNTVHDCGDSGIRFNPEGTRVSTRTPQALSFSNVNVTNNTLYNITGQNTLGNPGPPANCGFGIQIQTVDGGVVTGNLVHDISRLANNSTGQRGSPGIYCADANNIYIARNEIYNVGDINNGSIGNDLQGILTDFGSTNILIERNYIHDCLESAYGIDSNTFSAVPATLNNITVRYNIFANCGFKTAGSISGGGITVIPITSTDIITNVVVHNNTIYYTVPSTSGSFQLSTNSTTGAGMTLANNLFITGSAATILVFNGSQGANYKFLNNAYPGGNPLQRTITNGTPSSSVSDSIGVDGAAGLALTADPELIAPQPYLTAATAGPNPGGVIVNPPTNQIPPDQNGAALFRLGPSSPYVNNGINLSLLAPPQLTFPLPFAGQDFSFSGQNYNGSVIGDITCSRTSAAGTDLLFTDPIGRSFNTFAANTLRITAGRGLLIEESRQQLLANPGTPVTQTTGSITNGTNLVLWVNGTGSASVTAGTGTFSINSTGNTPVAAQLQPLSITMSSTGTLVITVNGSLNQFQLETDPNGNRQPTSFINAQTTRDADVVTSTTGTTFGAALQSALGSGGANRSGFVYFSLPCGYGAFPNDVGTLFTDNSNSSAVSLNSGNSVFPYSTSNAVFNCGAQSITSGNGATTNTRQAIAWQSNNAAGQLVCLNGGTVAANANSASPTLTSPMYIGSVGGTSKFLNGYIQRVELNSSTISQAQMQQYSSVAPIVPTPTQDFFGNPVPGPGGKFSIGAHQPGDGFANSLNFGFTITPNNIGTVTTGTVTPNPTFGNYQFLTNNGAFTLAAPTSDSAIDILVTNGASAGTITFSGFTVGSNTGDALTTTNTNKFLVSLRRVNGISAYSIQALQ